MAFTDGGHNYIESLDRCLFSSATSSSNIPRFDLGEPWLNYYSPPGPAEVEIMQAEREAYAGIHADVARKRADAAVEFEHCDCHKGVKQQKAEIQAEYINYVKKFWEEFKRTGNMPKVTPTESRDPSTMLPSQSSGITARKHIAPFKVESKVFDNDDIDVLQPSKKQVKKQTKLDPFFELSEKERNQIVDQKRAVGQAKYIDNIRKFQEELKSTGKMPDINKFYDEACNVPPEYPTKSTEKNTSDMKPGPLPSWDRFNY